MKLRIKRNCVFLKFIKIIKVLTKKIMKRICRNIQMDITSLGYQQPWPS